MIQTVIVDGPLRRGQLSFVAITFDTTELATKGDFGARLFSKISLMATRTAVYAYRPDRIRTAASFEARNAAVRTDDAAEQRANEAFRRDLAIGTETNCGTVIQLRGPMVETYRPGPPRHRALHLRPLTTHSRYRVSEGEAF